MSNWALKGSVRDFNLAFKFYTPVYDQIERELTDHHLVAPWTYPKLLLKFRTQLCGLRRVGLEGPF